MPVQIRPGRQLHDERDEVEQGGNARVDQLLQRSKRIVRTTSEELQRYSDLRQHSPSVSS